MFKSTLGTAVAFASLGLTVPALALDPAPIKMGGTELTPTLSFTEAYNDNFRERADESESWISTLSSNWNLAAKNQGNEYFVEYGFSSDYFHSSQDDNNTDHFVGAGAHIELNRRNRLDLLAGYNKIVSVEDTTILGQNDEFESSTLGGIYGFGVESATFQVDVGLNEEHLRYIGGSELSIDKERDVTGASITGYARLAPKTRALIELRQKDFDYVETDSRRNSTANMYMVGLTWEATAKTTGTVKVGYEEKDFDDKSITDQDDVTWEVGIAWQPRTYSIFQLNTRQAFDEARFSETFIESTSTTVRWGHAWSHKISTSLSATYVDEQFIDTTEREDKTWQYGIGVDYSLARWMSVGLAYDYKDAESDVAIRQYDRNLFALNIKLSL